MCTMYMPSAYGSQKSMQDSLELEFIMSYHVGARNSSLCPL